jgi:hypothetical protein
MTSNRVDLAIEVERQLRLLGYELCGDDDIGWYWQMGDFKSLTATLAFDTSAEALLAAFGDQVQRTTELLGAARQVVQRWSKGDLAHAVRDLDASAKALNLPA